MTVAGAHVQSSKVSSKMFSLTLVTPSAGLRRANQLLHWLTWQLIESPAWTRTRASSSFKQTTRFSIVSTSIPSPLAPASRLCQGEQLYSTSTTLLTNSMLRCARSPSFWDAVQCSFSHHELEHPFKQVHDMFHSTVVPPLRFR